MGKERNDVVVCSSSEDGSDRGRLGRCEQCLILLLSFDKCFFEEVCVW